MVDSHKNTKERVNAAMILQQHVTDIPIYIDRMDNKVSKAFGAYPERLYIIQNNIVQYQGKMGPMGYHLTEVKKWIEEYI